MSGLPKIDCLCVGILVADHLCEPISHLPAAGELVLADRLPLQIGGCAANAAADMAHLGINVAVLGCVGQDVFGQFLRETLQQHGVHTEWIRTTDQAETSGTLILNVDGQDRRFVHAKGANNFLHPRDIDLYASGDLQVLYVAGYLLMDQFEPAALAEKFAEAQARGIKTVLDVVLPDPGDYWPQVAPLLPYTDVFLPNSDEAEALSGKRDPVQQALHFRQAGASLVAITCGSSGAVLVGQDVAVRGHSHEVPFVGGTGAGDAFGAGFTAGLLAGLDPIGCLTWGTALGASCVQGVGATECTFARDQLLQFVAEHPLKVEPI